MGLIEPVRTVPNYTMVRAQTKEGYREQIVDLVTHRMKLSESHYMGVRQHLPRLYDLWRGTWTGRFHPHKNNAHIPLMFSAIWADAARKAATSLSTYPLVTFVGYGPNDRPVAQRWEALTTAQAKDDDMFIKQIDHIVSADLYGTALEHHGWLRKEEYLINESLDTLPLSGKIVRTIKRGKQVTFDGPTSVPIDLLDGFPEPGKKRVKEMRWFIRRYFLDLDEIRYLVSVGMFDKAELTRLERDGSVNSHIVDEQATVRRFAVRSGMDDETVRWMDRYSRPVELLEYWGYIPSELSPDGELSRVITVANRRYLLRNKPNPHWHKQIPITAFSPTPDLHYFYAPGKGEIIEKLQIVANRYLNQSLDAADLLIDPVYGYDRAGNINTKRFYLYPGKLVPMDGNPNQILAPLQKDLAGLTVADSRIAMVREYGQMGTGMVDDAVQGLQTDGRQTAREFVGRREAAGTRLQLESRLYEEMSLEPNFNFKVAHNKQYLETPTMIKILGDGAEVDPVTNEPIATTRTYITEADMVMDYAAKAMGATSALSKSMRQDRMIALLTALGTPLGQAAMGSINAVNFFRNVFREFEVPNINEMFMSQEQGIKAQFEKLIAQASGGQGDLSKVPASKQVVQGLNLPGNAAVPAEADISSMLGMMAGTP